MDWLNKLFLCTFLWSFLNHLEVSSGMYYTQMNELSSSALHPSHLSSLLSSFIRIVSYLELRTERSKGANSQTHLKSDADPWQAAWWDDLQQHQIPCITCQHLRELPLPKQICQDGIAWEDKRKTLCRAAVLQVEQGHLQIRMSLGGTHVPCSPMSAVQVSEPALAVWILYCWWEWPAHRNV